MAKRRIAPWKLAVGFVLVVVGGGWATLKYAEYRATNDAEAEASKLRKLGYPTTVSEFVARLPKQDDSNAASLYQQAIVTYESIGKPSTTLTDTTGKLDPALRLKFVRDTDSIYQILVNASQKENCAFPRDWGKGFEVLFPELAHMKTFARVCSSRADVAREAGDWRSALDNLAVGARVAAHSEDPSLIGHLVAIACDAIILRSFENLIGQFSNDAQFLADARTWLAQLPPPPDRTNAFDFEIVGCRTGIAQLSDPKNKAAWGMEADGVEDFLLTAFLKVPAARKRVEATYLTTMRKVLEAPYEDPWKDTARWEAMDKAVAADTSLVGKVTSILTPVFHQASLAFAKSATSRRVHDVALWVAEQRRQLGTLPHQLPDQERFQDPWTGKRYVYIKKGNDYIVRSVGPNKVDDGGPRGNPGNRTDDFDVEIPRAVP